MKPATGETIMKRIRCGFSVLLFASGAAFAGDVYKCVDADGKVTFSDTSCPSAAQEKVQTVKSARPEAAQGQDATTPPANQKRGGLPGKVDRARELEQPAKTPQ
jgi:hypothetical protein